MKSVTISEANQNFSKVVKLVIEEQAITIDKNGESKFVLMTLDEYKRLKGEIYWTEGTDGSFRKIETSGMQVMIYELSPADDGLYRYTQYRFPSDVFTIRETENGIEMNLDDIMYRAMNSRDIILSFSSDILDLSKQPKRGKGNADNEVAPFVEATGLLAEYKALKTSNPDSIYQDM